MSYLCWNPYEEAPIFGKTFIGATAWWLGDKDEGTAVHPPGACAGTSLSGVGPGVRGGPLATGVGDESHPGRFQPLALGQAVSQEPSTPLHVRSMAAPCTRHCAGKAPAALALELALYPVQLCFLPCSVREFPKIRCIDISSKQ